MKRLTTLALLAGMLSAPALHSEEPGSGAAAPLSFPQLNDAADSEPGDEPPAASPEEGASPAAPATAGDAAATAPAPVMPDLPPPVSGTAAPEVIPVAPVWGGDLNLAQMGMPDGIILSGGQRQGGVSFTLPADQVVIHSQLSLAVRVSPEMASRNATLQLMLNGQPLGTLPLGADGEDVSHYQLDIPPALMVSSNNLSVKINDGDTLQCQRDIHDTSRVTVLPTSHFSWESQQLNISDDLSHFPRPFFDSMQMTPADIAVAYGAKPSADVFSAAALISSWLGIQADYRGIAFSALRDRLPERHGIVIGHPGEQVGGMMLPETDKPLLRIIANPANPAYKLLLIVGKNDTALRMAAWRLTRGNFAPQTATLDVEPQTIPVGKAYDAPRWIPTDRPVKLSELLRKDQSPTVSGVWHEPLRIAFRAAPDLYLWDGETIPLQVGYRFPSESWINEDKSLLSVTLNGTFLNNLPMPGGSIDNCITFQPVQNHVVIGDDSTIDFSKYYHFIALPDLRVFANAGFPYSRMADLSDTLVVVPKAPTQGQVATLLQALGGIGSQTGLAAINLQMTDDGNQIKNKDADLLLIGAIPSSLKDDTKINLLVEATKSWVKMPMRHYDLASIYPDDEARTPNTRTDITSSGPMAAVIGFQSPYNDQRSVVALLADSPRGNELLTNALNDSGKRAAMFGSVAVIRESGVNSLRVGDIYYVGHLPWFERIWFALSNHPILLAIFAAISIVLLAWVLWRMLRIISRRRLSLDDE
ncbi:TPA: cellulose biosynthesis cyclic di-GMP-binding regulatory protein BcsB [Klebsiella pneumoniae]